MNLLDINPFKLNTNKNSFLFICTQHLHKITETGTKRGNPFHLIDRYAVVNESSLCIDDVQSEGLLSDQSQLLCEFNSDGFDLGVF